MAHSNQEHCDSDEHNEIISKKSELRQLKSHPSLLAPLDHKPKMETEYLVDGELCGGRKELKNYRSDNAITHARNLNQRWNLAPISKGRVLQKDSHEQIALVDAHTEEYLLRNLKRNSNRRLPLEESVVQSPRLTPLERRESSARKNAKNHFVPQGML